MTHKEFKREFGKAVRFRRKLEGIKQIEFAKMICITQGALSRLERGQIGFDSDTLFNICKALNLEPRKLFMGVFL